MLLSRELIVETVKKVDTLPPIPEIVLQLEQLLSRPDASVHNLVKLLQQDIGLVANVLRLANSAYYGGNTRLASVEQAAIRLGLHQVRQIVCISATVAKYRTVAPALSARYWSHSLAVAMAAQSMLGLCQHSIPKDDQEAVFVAGLMHDLGVLAMMHCFPEQYEALLARLREQGGESNQHELACWGIEHGEIGAHLVTSWKLPPPVEQAIRFHHRPELATPDHRGLVQLVHLADFVCNNQGYGRDDAEFPNWFDPEAWDSLGLSIDQCSSIMDRVRAEGEKSIVLMQALTP